MPADPAGRQTRDGVFWRPAETLAQRVSKLRDEAIVRYKALIALLLEGHHLTRSEANALSPNLDLQVIDARLDRSQPLPVFNSR